MIDHKEFYQLNEIGIALSKEPSRALLLEKILTAAKELTHAEGGTLYTVQERALHFEIALSDPLGLHVGGSSGKPIFFPPLPLFLKDGSLNNQLVVTYAANHQETVNITHVAIEKRFDFSATYRFDQQMGYKTYSLLTLPIKNHEEEVIAVLQLINHRDPETGETTPFTREDEQLAASLASQAGVALTNRLLMNQLQGLFESLIRVIAEAIDEKSPFTGHHSKRVPLIARLLAEAVNQSKHPAFRDLHFNQDALYALEIAAYLHDCGKIVTPVHLMEKQTRLQTVFDRIALIEARIAIRKITLERDLLLKKWLWIETEAPLISQQAQAACEEDERKTFESLNHLEATLRFLYACNQCEKLAEDDRARLYQLADQYPDLLTADELENLSLREGNLTEKERQVIRAHVVMTYRMLSQILFPKELRRVAEIAASHHERIDGKGYPRGLKGEEIPVEARILAIADVFESLSAPDRPYKKALPLSQVFEKMRQMAEEGHLDQDLLELFLDKEVYLPYAEKYLNV